MSLEISELSVAAPSQDRAKKDQTLGDPNNCPHDSMVLRQVNDAPLAAPYQDDINPASHEPQERGKQTEKADLPLVEESAEARLERLGRQRPEVFDSIWSEIGFVFSISMSQVLSVRSPLPISLFHP
jgi:hypothetical protein